MFINCKPFTCQLLKTCNHYEGCYNVRIAKDKEYKTYQESKLEQKMKQIDHTLTYGE